MDEKKVIPLTEENNRHSDKCADSDGKVSFVIGMEDMNLKAEKPEETEEPQLK